LLERLGIICRILSRDVYGKAEGPKRMAKRAARSLSEKRENDMAKKQYREQNPVRYKSMRADCSIESARYIIAGMFNLPLDAIRLVLPSGNAPQELPAWNAYGGNGIRMDKSTQS
jgi:hypothetical protein